MPKFIYALGRPIRLFCASTLTIGLFLITGCVGTPQGAARSQSTVTAQAPLPEPKDSTGFSLRAAETTLRDKLRNISPLPKGQKPRIVATFTVVADIVKNVAGPDSDVESLMKPGTEIHSYQPTPSDLKRVSDANLILDNGLGLEAWLAPLTHQGKTPSIELSTLSRPVMIPGSEHPNPHAWMSPEEAANYAWVAARAMGALDPENAVSYTNRAYRYAAEIRRSAETLIPAIRKETARHGKPLLATCEGAFSYLTRDLGLEEAYLWPVNSEREGTPRQIARLIDQVKAHKTPTVYCESTVNPQAAQRVAEETGAKLGPPLVVDSLAEKESEGPTSYLELLRYNLRIIKEGLARD